MSLTLVIGNKNYSSWPLRPWLFLKFHGIAFEEIRIPLYREASKDQILKFSPAGKVPVFLDGGLKVWDSLAILEYLAERFPETQGWPEDCWRVHWRQKCTQVSRRCGMNCRRLPATKQLPEAVHSDIERIGQIWRECRQRYGDKGPWLFGRFTITDAMYAPVALRIHGYQLQTHPEALNYAATVLDYPAVREWIESGQRETEVIPAFEE